MDTRHASGQAIDQAFTRRDYLVYQAVMNGADTLYAMETVDTWATEHPEHDMDEKMTWAEWQGLDGVEVVERSDQPAG